jgi:nitrogen fixation protein FixH
VGEVTVEVCEVKSKRVVGKSSARLTAAPEQVIELVAAHEGQYRSTKPLAGGRWIVRLSVRRDGHEARFVREVSR